jgi:hypothetical protein
MRRGTRLHANEAGRQRRYVFQVHGIDAAEKVVIRKQLRRGQVLKFFASLRGNRPR